MDTHDCAVKVSKIPFVGISPVRKLEETFLHRKPTTILIFLNMPKLCDLLILMFQFSNFIFPDIFALHELNIK